MMLVPIARLAINGPRPKTESFGSVWQTSVWFSRPPGREWMRSGQVQLPRQGFLPRSHRSNACFREQPFAKSDDLGLLFDDLEIGNEVSAVNSKTMVEQRYQNSGDQIVADQAQSTQCDALPCRCSVDCQARRIESDATSGNR